MGDWGIRRQPRAGAAVDASEGVGWDGAGAVEERRTP